MTELPISELDCLTARIAAGDASGDEWRSFERFGATEPAAWETLARALRDELAARTAGNEAMRAAEETELPDAAPPPLRAAETGARWRGWAAAAAVALAWAGYQFVPGVRSGIIGGPGSGALIQAAGPGGSAAADPLDADGAFDRYMRIGRDEGRILQMLPTLMIQTRPAAAEGAIEVVYLRRVLERAEVDSVYHYGAVDEFGRPVPVPLDKAVLLNRDQDPSL
jgi:hypothetical protein